MNGIPIDPIKNIMTAIQATASIPDVGILNALPGIAMSLGGLLNNILSLRSLSKNLKNNMPGAAFAALGSVNALIQSMEQNESSGFLTAGRVNEDVYTQNAMNLLGQCTNLSDVMSTMTRLQSDTSLFGMEAFGPTVVEQLGPVGSTFLSITGTGKQLELTPAAVAQGLNTLSSLMSGAGFPGAVPGENMFGESSGTILNMMQRIPGGAGFSQALSIAQQLNTSGVAQQIFNVANEVFSGGNPLNKL